MRGQNTNQDDRAGAIEPIDKSSPTGLQDHGQTAQIQIKRRVGMRKVEGLSVAFLIGILSVLAGGSPVRAAICPGPKGSTIKCGPLEYHGGPFLEKFEIYPLYYGTWTDAQIDAQQAYVVSLAAYMSGKNAPERPAADDETIRRGPCHGGRGENGERESRFRRPVAKQRPQYYCRQPSE